MPRGILSVKAEGDEIFASEDGSRAQIASMSKGFDASYTSTSFPKRKNMNDILAYVSSGAKDVNKGGAGLPYDERILYDEKAVVLFNGVHYVAQQQLKDVLPIDAGYINPAYWKTLRRELGIDDLLIRDNTLKITSCGSSPVKKVAVANQARMEQSYTIADLLDAASLLIPENITSVSFGYDVSKGSSSYNYDHVYVTYPDGEWVYINKRQTHSDETTRYTYDIPINAGQTEFSIRIDNIKANAYFELMYATQLVRQL